MKCKVWRLRDTLTQKYIDSSRLKWKLLFKYRKGLKIIELLKLKHNSIFEPMAAHKQLKLVLTDSTNIKEPRLRKPKPKKHR